HAEVNGLFILRRLPRNFERELMRGMAVHRCKAQKLRIKTGGGDLCFGLCLAAAPEKRRQARKIIRGCGRAFFLAEGTAFAERCFKEATILARERRQGMFAKVAACHQG